MKMKPSERKLLTPFAEEYAKWETHVRSRDSEELDALERACASASGTNCWYAVFYAAQILLPMVRAERQRRAIAAKTEGTS